MILFALIRLSKSGLITHSLSSLLRSLSLLYNLFPSLSQTLHNFRYFFWGFFHKLSYKSNIVRFQIASFSPALRSLPSLRSDVETLEPRRSQTTVVFGRE